MTIATNYRRSSLQEVIAEMDRRGDVIEALEARIVEMEATIKRLKPYEPSWENPDGPTAA